MEQAENVGRVAAHFQIAEPAQHGERIGDGHIHHSFRCTAGDGKQYILQQVNDSIFGDPIALAQNIELVVNHVRAAGSLPGGPDRNAAGSDVDVPDPVPVHEERASHEPGSDSYGTAANRFLLRLDDRWWRMWHAVPDTVTGPVPAAPDDAHSCGIGFGSFLRMTADMEPGRFHVPIPDFHNIELRMQQLSEAVTADQAGRAGGVRKELGLIAERSPQMLKYYRWVRTLAPRVTHNDTKFTNILLDVHDRSPRAVIDLDTVMPGSVAYDFGDGARSGTSTAAEDTPDSKEMTLNTEAFYGYADGFLLAARLQREERDLLEHAASYMTLIMAVRFLADYLDGDRYYHTRTDDQNLRRCRAQLALLQDLEAQADLVAKAVR